ncbi:hypothetical protein K431DRAFT_286478 [Polychaeton citri CBS 116435]|uniref:Uncharacterized protein n=1 Tax=Polychaeton citri CBS 116435 TaxID=1314669 RepID=A0A9P4Q503_9PEZI|nr:hypothetical protein K431DRAFT_286478 [Polychaeton citri CBS 116435]
MGNSTVALLVATHNSQTRPLHTYTSTACTQVGDGRIAWLPVTVWNILATSLCLLCVLRDSKSGYAATGPVAMRILAA